MLNGLEEELWERGRSELTRPYSELERGGGRRVKGRSGGLGNGSGFVLECCVERLVFRNWNGLVEWRRR